MISTRARSAAVAGAAALFTLVVVFLPRGEETPGVASTSSGGVVQTAPEHPAPGDAIAVASTGFAPNAAIDVFLDDRVASTVTADPAGRVAATVWLDADHDRPQRILLSGRGASTAQLAVSSTVQPAWPSRWADYANGGASALAVLAAAAGITLAGTAAVVLSHRRRVGAEA